MVIHRGDAEGAEDRPASSLPGGRLAVFRDWAARRSMEASPTSSRVLVGRTPRVSIRGWLKRSPSFSIPSLRTRYAR